MLNILGDVFQRSQHVTDNEFIAKLEHLGIEHTVHRIDRHDVVGPFGAGKQAV